MVKVFHEDTLIRNGSGGIIDLPEIDGHVTKDRHLNGEQEVRNIK